MNLKDLRTKRSLTQQQVADAIGCSVMVYSRYERETRQPSIDVLIRLSDLFGVTIDYLVGKEQVEDGTLSSYERALVVAARNADDRAREDALHLLESHTSPD